MRVYARIFYSFNREEMEFTFCNVSTHTVRWTIVHFESTDKLGMSETRYKFHVSAKARFLMSSVLH